MSSFSSPSSESAVPISVPSAARTGVWRGTACQATGVSSSNTLLHHDSGDRSRLSDDELQPAAGPLCPGAATASRVKPRAEHLLACALRGLRRSLLRHRVWGS